MTSVEFKRNGLLYWAHSMVMMNEPKDTCTYKRNILFTICVLLVTIHATVLRSVPYLFKNHRSDYNNQGLKSHLVFILFSFLSILVGYSIIEGGGVIPDFIYWTKLSILSVFGYSFIAMFMGILVVGVFIGLACLGVFLLLNLMRGLVWVWNKIASSAIVPSYLNRDGEPETQLGVVYQSYKEKWCKKINWK
tara:strand:- start:4676 stop:5251 length:576 start_codon:yes stop_codon:yes gene_type:complete